MTDWESEGDDKKYYDECEVHVGKIKGIIKYYIKLNLNLNNKYNHKDKHNF